MRLTLLFGGFVLALTVALGLAMPARARTSVPAVPIEDPVTARLVAETGAIAPGETIWLALHLEIEPGWHVYWRNPGDSGLPTEIAWTLPSGFTAGQSNGRCPSALSAGSIGNYGYAGAVDLLIPLTARPLIRSPAAGRRRAGRGACDLARLLRYLHSGRGGSFAGPARHRGAFRSRSRECGAVCRRHAQRLPQPAAVRDSVRRIGRRFEAACPGNGVRRHPEPDRLVLSDRAQPDRRRGRATPEIVPDGLDLLLKPASGPGPVRRCRRALTASSSLRGGRGTERSYAIAAPIVAAAPNRRDRPRESPVTGWWHALLLAFLGGAC